MLGAIASILKTVGILGDSMTTSEMIFIPTVILRFNSREEASVEVGTDRTFHSQIIQLAGPKNHSIQMTHSFVAEEESDTIL